MFQNLVGEGQPSSGNFGLSDQINALRWIKDYIRQFGGNPDLVSLLLLVNLGMIIIMCYICMYQICMLLLLYTSRGCNMRLCISILQITVAGLGSGGTSILALMANSEARTYFQRAWISGASSKFDGAKEDTYKSNTDTILR